MIDNFSIENWTLLSDRRNSKTFVDSKKEWILKFFANEEENLDTLLREQQLAKNVASLGLLTPNVGEIVKLKDGKMGLMYEYMEDKVSLARAIDNDSTKCEYYCKLLAEEGKKLHSTKCDKTKFRDTEEVIKSILPNLTIFDSRQKELIYKKIEETPKADTCLHGDYQLGNYIIHDNKVYIIDIGYFGYGNPLYDIGVWCFLNRMMPRPAACALFRCDEEILQKSWYLSLKYYFNLKTPEEIKEKEKEIAPYAFLGVIKTLETADPGHVFDYANPAFFDDAFSGRGILFENSETVNI